MEESSQSAQLEQLGIKIGPEVYFNANEGYARADELFGRIHTTAFFLPDGAEFPKERHGQDALARITQVLNLDKVHSRPENNDKFPIAYTRVRHEGHTGFAVTICEQPHNLFEPFEGTRPFYRYSSLNQLELIKEHGFYQIPGRTAFYTTDRTTGWLVNDRVEVVFDLEHHEVIEGEGRTASLAFPENGVFPSIRLPEAIRGSLGNLHFYSTGESPPNSQSELARQVLLAGDLAKVLLRIPPDKINTEKTLEANRAHLEDGRITQETHDRVVSILTR
jgi:hypothetical protein